MVQSTEREGNQQQLSQKSSLHIQILLKFGSVHGYPDYEPDLTVGKRAVQDVNDQLQA